MSLVDYLRNLDAKVASTKAYFSDVRRRLSGIPYGTTVIDEETGRLMGQDEEDTKAYFQQMRTDAADGWFFGNFFVEELILTLFVF